MHTHTCTYTCIHTQVIPYSAFWSTKDNIHTYIHIYIYTCTYTYTCIHTCTYTCIHTQVIPYSAFWSTKVNIHTYIHTYIHTHIHIHAYTHTHVYKQVIPYSAFWSTKVNIHTYIHIYIYTYTYTYTRIHTHTCIHTQVIPYSAFWSTIVKQAEVVDFTLNPSTQMSKKQLLDFISRIYCEKLVADELDDRAKLPRQTLPEFLYDFHLERLLEPQLAEAALVNVVANVRIYDRVHTRVHMFSRFLNLGGQPFPLEALNIFLVSLVRIQNGRFPLLTDAEFISVDAARSLKVIEYVFGQAPHVIRQKIIMEAEKRATGMPLHAILYVLCACVCGYVFMCVCMCVRKSLWRLRRERQVCFIMRSCMCSAHVCAGICLCVCMYVCERATGMLRHAIMRMCLRVCRTRASVCMHARIHTGCMQ
jgi:hypothetical protein